MKLVFTKGAGKFDRLEAVRPGQPPETIDCPKQRIIPHDMVHYAVEHTLGARGFLKRVAEGEAASFRMQGEDHSDAVERLVEVFQGDEWSGGGSAPSEMIELYRVTCSARGCPMLPVDDAAILAVRAAIARLSEQWQALPVGGSLELSL
jgi:hypothetical protein